jgi:bacterioferritin-associated ferredoxin
MIICSCAVISADDIRRAIAWMRAADPDTVITPGKVYRALGKRPDCGGCLSLFIAIMGRDDNTAVPVELRGLRAPTKGGGSHERREEGHRTAEPGAEA